MSESIRDRPARSRRRFSNDSIRAAVALVVVAAGCTADARPADEPAQERERRIVARRVALTFDDLPANSFRESTEAFRTVTAPLVATLSRHAIPAIGFVNEAKLYVDGRPHPDRVATLQSWIDAGLELGNHSYSHPDLHSTALDEF